MDAALAAALRAAASADAAVRHDGERALYEAERMPVPFFTELARLVRGAPDATDRFLASACLRARLPTCWATFSSEERAALIPHVFELLGTPDPRARTHAAATVAACVRADAALADADTKPPSARGNALMLGALCARVAHEALPSAPDAEEGALTALRRSLKELLALHHTSRADAPDGGGAGGTAGAAASGGGGGGSGGGATLRGAAGALALAASSLGPSLLERWRTALAAAASAASAPVEGPLLDRATVHTRAVLPVLSLPPAAAAADGLASAMVDSACAALAPALSAIASTGRLTDRRARLVRSLAKCALVTLVRAVEGDRAPGRDESAAVAAASARAALEPAACALVRVAPLCACSASATRQRALAAAAAGADGADAGARAAATAEQPGAAAGRGDGGGGESEPLASEHEARRMALQLARLLATAAEMAHAAPHAAPSWALEPASTDGRGAGGGAADGGAAAASADATASALAAALPALLEPNSAVLAEWEADPEAFALLGADDGGVGDRASLRAQAERLWVALVAARPEASANALAQAWRTDDAATAARGAEPEPAAHAWAGADGRRAGAEGGGAAAPPGHGAAAQPEPRQPARPPPGAAAGSSAAAPARPGGGLSHALSYDGRCAALGLAPYEMSEAGGVRFGALLAELMQRREAALQAMDVAVEEEARARASTWAQPSHASVAAAGARARDAWWTLALLERRAPWLLACWWAFGSSGDDAVDAADGANACAWLGDIALRARDAAARLAAVSAVRAIVNASSAGALAEPAAIEGSARMLAPLGVLARRCERPDAALRALSALAAALDASPRLITARVDDYGAVAAAALASHAAASAAGVSKPAHTPFASNGSAGATLASELVDALSATASAHGALIGAHPPLLGSLAIVLRAALRAHLAIAHAPRPALLRLAANVGATCARAGMSENSSFGAHAETLAQQCDAAAATAAAVVESPLDGGSAGGGGERGGASPAASQLLALATQLLEALEIVGGSSADGSDSADTQWGSPSEFDEHGGADAVDADGDVW